MGKSAALRQLVSALFPLVLFWAIEEFWGLKAALVAGCIGAFVELGWERYSLGRVTFLTLVSNLLVLVLGGVSFFMDSGVAFKLQPFAMELGMAGFLVMSRVMGPREPFLIQMFRQNPVIPEDRRQLLMQQDWFIAKLRGADTRLVLFLILHGLAVGWAAIWGSTRVWILLKGVLFYVLLVLVMVPMYKRPRESVKQSV